MKTSVEGSDANYGLYVWRKADGQIFGDSDGNILNIPAMRGDLEALQTIRKAAAHYGEPEGSPVFVPGVGRTSDAQRREDLDMMQQGITPYGDTEAYKDAFRRGR